ncbi:ribosome small subunit-dependent GTPase A [Desulfovibrio gilichinskyi]|uniref:Small ribosomal subunit biogenesis GTPase RsgA n=1 Tax=Desulfovibrio gilichinskyi TaxID=1519643 RepID=A0A1X7CJY2_9BACT|nr:ribosome small subunit-dependent GTPase A [Desulfovibrio gilichinskyi]SME97995.1 ribosome biogenesis GTPase [Desulfovibrio gilichinskyi]
MTTLINRKPISDHIEQLRRLGLDDHLESQLELSGILHDNIARVLSVQRNLFLVSNGRDEWLCTPSGRMLHQQQEYPVTGDWVLADDGVVKRVLPRRTFLCRGESGSRGKNKVTVSREQPIAANINAVFIVCGLDRDYNLRRIERYLALVYNCGIKPVVVLTKADLHEYPESFRDEVESIAFGVSVVLTSMIDGSGTDELHSYLGCGQTVAMLGSSGAGKSTLTNLLYGSDIQATAAVSRSVGKGRHTTTVRELIHMPQGGMLMDNPGIREVSFYADGDGVDTVFSDIQELSGLCRFADCSHMREPGCAVLKAVENGELPLSRLESYRKMKREMEYVSARSEKSADRIEKERWKDVTLSIKRMKIRK